MPPRADVYAAGKCVMCVAKTTMHDDSGVGARAGRQRAKPQTNRERNLRDVEAAVCEPNDVSALRRVALVQAGTRTSSSGTSAWTPG